MRKWAPGHRQVKGLLPFPQYRCHFMCVTGHHVSLFGHFQLFVIILCLLTELCDFETTNMNTPFILMLLTALAPGPMPSGPIE